MFVKFHNFFIKNQYFRGKGGPGRALLVDKDMGRLYNKLGSQYM